MRLLVTGGFGYLGGRLAQFLGSCGNHEILLGSRRPADSPPWMPEAKVVQTLWESSAALQSACASIDTVVHLAGMNAHDCAADPVAALEFNGVATARLLGAAARAGVRRFIYLSTAHVYGAPLAGVITEQTCPAPRHPYATSHRAGEDVVHTARKQGEICGIVVRLSNAYGAPAHEQTDCWTLLVNDLCRQAATSPSMVLRSSGMQRRDFVTLTDTCRAIAHLMELPYDRLDCGLFNVGGAWAPPVLEMAERIADRFQAVTGNRRDILRNMNQGMETPEFLEYRIERLVSTGFSLRGGDAVDHEIDDLIQFCLRHRP